jgi:biotin synthase
MNLNFKQLAEKSISGNVLTKNECKLILNTPSSDTLQLLDAAYTIRKKYWNNSVSIHVLNNAKNGNCPEDCSYCVQAKTSDTAIADYPIKSEDEILEEAKSAFESGAFRYCMVFSGRGPSKPRIKKLSGIIKKIKETYPIQVCLSPGLIDDEDAQSLKSAGLDRLNHNLNTSEKRYASICTTHTYQDRLNTLLSAKKAGLETCSGIIVGMGETHDDIIEVALKLRDLNSRSIPVNFYIPVKGAPLAEQIDPYKELTPEFCLRVLCLFRFLNPTAEIRAAAGREIHLRSMQSFAFYPANSIFMDGYLNTKGTNMVHTLQMIKDAGFKPKTDFDLDALLNKAKKEQPHDAPTDALINSTDTILKQMEDLRPAS